MPIEVELKARLTDANGTLAVLRTHADGRKATYWDTYYDWPDGALERNGRQELRLRTIETADNVRHLWTFKAPALDPASIPEYETAVADRDAAHAILAGLGLAPVIAYTKNCENFRYAHAGHDILATVVTIPEIDGTFLEIETVIPDDHDTRPAEQAITSALTTLGLSDTDLEPTYYIDLVRAGGTR